MSQTFKLISDILKEQYLPAFRNQITTEPSPFLQMIKKRPMVSGKVVAATPFGINGGFGFSDETGTMPSPGAQEFRRFEISPVDMYVDIRLTDKVVKLGGDSGALINALDEEVAGSYKAAKWNLGRALFGDGTGMIAKVVKPLEVNSNGTMSSWIGVDRTSNLIEGLNVNMHIYRNATDVTAFQQQAVYRILSVDHANKRVLVNGLPEYSVQTTKENSETGAGYYGYMTVQGSKNKELVGLGAIFNDKVSTLYGLNKSENTWIIPLTVDAKNDLSDITIYDAVKKAQDYRNSRINLVMMGDNAFRAFRNYMRENNVSLVDKQEFVGGASGFKVAVGNGVVTVVNEKMVPENEAWGVDTETFSLQMVDFDFCDFGGTGIFQLLPGTCQYRALLSAYGNLICSNPGGCVRIVNCNEAG